MKARLSIWLASSALCAVLLPATADAIPIDKVVYVRPVSVCDNAGNNCTDVNQFMNLSAQATKDIWKQAGYDVVFLPGRTGAGQTVNSSALLSIDSEAEARNLIRDNVLDINSTVIEAFLVNAITAPVPAYGWGFIDNPGVIISNQTVAANRFDTLAHEIGHNFGLDHGNFGNNPQSAQNLMTALRTVPTALNQIAGNGGTLDALNGQQITEARNGVTVDPTSSIGRAAGRVEVGAPVDCFPFSAASAGCSAFTVTSTGQGSFVRAVKMKFPGLNQGDPSDSGDPYARFADAVELLNRTGGASSETEVDFVDETVTVTFLDRNIDAGTIFDFFARIHGGVRGSIDLPDLDAEEISIYFSDGYEVDFGYDGIFADSQEDLIDSRFRGVVPETGDINTVLPEPVVTGVLTGPFELADPQLVPEPGALALFLTALLGLGAAARGHSSRRR